MSGLALNEDNSHFFRTRTADDMTTAGLKQLVDNYTSPQMRELFFNPNAMRTNCASKVWQPIWKGYDPDAGDDQPFFKGTATRHDDPRRYEALRRWVRNALLLHQNRINPYQVWLDATREKGISAWITMRMNDVHDVNNPDSFFHSDLWRQRPDLRRVPYRLESWLDNAFDYGKQEVRDHHLALVKEYLEMYDLDGLELDWMRFGYHFTPGHEQAGRHILTDFVAEVRRLADEHARRRGHPIKLGVRVPSRPETARDMGMDAVEWARKGLVDMIVITPFFATIEFDMPVELWKELLGDAPVTLAAGLEILIGTFPSDRHHRMRNTAETVRGAAASLLHRGADRIYLFNYMDSETTVDSADDYQAILNQAGSIKTATAHPRRHVVTFADTWPPGVPTPHALPVECRKTRPAAFRIHIGPRPARGSAQVFIGLGEAGRADANGLEVHVNTGELCRPSTAQAPKAPPVVKTMAGFEIDLSALNDGYNHVDAATTSEGPYEIVWVEIKIG